MKRRKGTERRPVYSTAPGPEGIGKPGILNVNEKQAGNGIVCIGRETKGRKGAGVTVVTGLPLDSDGLSDLAGKLKRFCGAGGTVRENVIEIQGEHRDRLAAELVKMGYKVKRSGG